MRRTLNKFFAFPFYIWLLGLYPILYLYSQNLGLVIDHEVVNVLGWVLGTTTVAFLGINLLLRDRFKTATLIGTAMIFFSLSGHVYNLALEPTAVHVDVAMTLWTQFVLAVSIATLYVVHRTVSSDLSRKATKTINLIMVALLVTPASAIASDIASRRALSFESSEDPTSADTDQASPKIKDSPSHPDIYYIIPDEYSSNSWMQDEMNLDNSAFTKALESRGFVVADRGQSNYGSTLHSLASTLNMRYITNNDSTMKDLEYLRMQIADNEVARRLRERGYTYVQLLSGFLLPSPLADINRDFTPSGAIDIKINRSDLLATIIDGVQSWENKALDLGLSYKQSFIKLYFDTTVLRFLSSGFLEDHFIQLNQPYGLFSPARFLSTIEEVANIALMPEATFTVVHLMKPHGPVVFDAQGNIVSATWHPSHEQYFAELEYVNTEFLRMIDAILNASANPPVIIFQADTGNKYSQLIVTGEQLSEFEAFAAYYLPDGYAIRFPEPFTFVNTFPLVLNEIFGTDFTLREDRLFKHSSAYKKPFVQQDVTDEFIVRQMR